MAAMEVKCRRNGKHSFVTISPVKLPLDSSFISLGKQKIRYRTLDQFGVCYFH